MALETRERRLEWRPDYGVSRLRYASGLGGEGMFMVSRQGKLCPRDKGRKRSLYHPRDNCLRA